MSDTPTSTPDWIKEAKASREQLECAFEVATEMVDGARAKYSSLCARRDRDLMATEVTVSGTPTTIHEREILVLQHRIVEAARDLESAMRDQLDIRSALMGIK